MSGIEDPYFSVRDEVKKTMTSARQLYERWKIISKRGAITASTEDELSWVTGELRNALRSIEWDLEDLEETIGIVEKNPRKFRLDIEEVRNRRSFVDGSRNFVLEVTQELDNPPSGLPSSSGDHSLRYSHAQSEVDASNDEYIENSHMQQQQIISQQDGQIEAINSGISVLKGMSSQIGRELDQQAVMLDEFGREMENTESRMDNTMKKIARVMRMSNDRRQWIAIIVLAVLLLVVIILLIVL